MKKKLFAITLAIFLLIGCIAVGSAATDAVTTFDELQTAVSNAGTETIMLSADIDGNTTLAISKDVTLDLNGYDITCPIEVADEATLYCMDSQTDDYTVSDAYGYGKLTNVTGVVSAVPAKAHAPESIYLMITEKDTNTDINCVSFHKVYLKITGMTLRAEDAGVYYDSKFAGDEVVADHVATFGIALSVREVPNAENMNTKCQYSKFTNFSAGINSNVTSTLLKNIMKAENPDYRNTNNSKMAVYGRPYICTINEEYIFGNTANRSLYEQVQLANSDQWWIKWSNDQKDAMATMFEKYAVVMEKWDVHNIESRICLGNGKPLAEAMEGKTLKLLAITSSFGKNTTQFLYDIAIAQGYENVTVARVYAGGVTLQEHAANAQNSSRKFYEYTRISNIPGDPGYREDGHWMKITNSDRTNCKNGTSLAEVIEAEDWDIIFMQNGGFQSPQLNTYKNYIDIVRDYVDQHQPNAKFVWNMVWGVDHDYAASPFTTTFSSNQMLMYQCNVNATLKKVLTRTDYDRLIPSGTVIQNARSYYSQLPGEAGRDARVGESLCKDKHHLNNKGKVMAGYGLFAVLTGQEWTEETMLKNPIGEATLENWSEYWRATTHVDPELPEDTTRENKGSDGQGAIYLNQADLNIYVESINNALRKPFEVTETQYTYGN